MTNIVKVMKYPISTAINMEWSEFNKQLFKLGNEARVLANKTIQECWYYTNAKKDYKEEHGAYPKDKEFVPIIYPKATQGSLDGVIYGIVKNYAEAMSANSINAMVQMASKKFKNDIIEVLRGDKSIASYKSVPIELPSKSVRLSKSESNGDYNAVVTLFNTGYKKAGKVNSTSIGLKLGCKKQKSMKDILDRLINGEYKLGACKINRGKKGWELIVVYSFEKAAAHGLDTNNVMGIDMGVVYPVYWALNNGWERDKIEGGDIDKFRKGIEARRLSMLKQGKESSRKGKGRKKLLKPTEVLEGKIVSFRNSTNHNYANYIVQTAIKHRCGTIQMEDLSGISKDNLFLKNWTYFDLQTKIEHQAKANGVKVIKVKPNYTSQRCHHCGVIDKENRESQAMFHCKTCDKKFNADYNAAKNISTIGIEKIIQDQLKAQEKVEKLSAK